MPGQGCWAVVPASMPVSTAGPAQGAQCIVMLPISILNWLLFSPLCMTIKEILTRDIVFARSNEKQRHFTKEKLALLMLRFYTRPSVYSKIFSLPLPHVGRNYDQESELATFFTKESKSSK